MGVYKYFLRKPSIKANIQGSIVPVHPFSYSFKFHYNPEDERRQHLITENAARVWEGKPLPQFCFLGDMPTKENREKGWLVEVYTNLTSYGWTDTNRFPGVAVGGLLVKGREVKFLGARDYLIAENEERIRSMMCSPEQPGIKHAQAQIAYLKELWIGGNHPVQSPGPETSLYSVDELRNGRVILAIAQAPANA